jgi:hypothetical protein
MFHFIALKGNELTKEEINKPIRIFSEGSMKKIHAIPGSLFVNSFGMTECSETLYAMIGTHTAFANAAKRKIILCDV